MKKEDTLRYRYISYVFRCRTFLKQTSSLTLSFSNPQLPVVWIADLQIIPTLVTFCKYLCSVQIKKSCFLSLPNPRVYKNGYYPIMMHNWVQNTYNHSKKRMSGQELGNYPFLFLTLQLNHSNAVKSLVGISVSYNVKLY